MKKKLATNLLNIVIMVFGIFFMFLSNQEYDMFLGIGLFVPSVLNLLFNSFND